jgi:hypothetical protein
LLQDNVILWRLPKTPPVCAFARTHCMAQNGKAVQNRSYDGHPKQNVKLSVLGNAVCSDKHDTKL